MIVLLAPPTAFEFRFESVSIGTRKSPLAIKQAEMIAAAIELNTLGTTTTLVPPEPGPRLLTPAPPDGADGSGRPGVAAPVAIEDVAERYLMRFKKNVSHFVDEEEQKVVRSPN